jgi:hypothetical protein
MYLDELSKAIGLNIAELVIVNEDVAIESAKALIAQMSRWRSREG